MNHDIVQEEDKVLNIVKITFEKGEMGCGT
jgi:hypothetical protein